MTVRRLILLRHGQTDHNATSRMQGQLDTELSEMGRRQAYAVGRELAGLRPNMIVASDLRRAYDTALAVGESAGESVRADRRLRETHLGRWQGCTHYEVDSVFPGARERWRADATWAPPGGESRVQVAERAVPAVLDAVGEVDATGTWGGRPLIVVAHGGVIAAVTASLLALPVTSWPAIGGIGNTAWAQLSSHRGGAAPRWRLDAWNTTTGAAHSGR